MSQHELNAPPPMTERSKQAAFIPRQQVASTSREADGSRESPQQPHDHESGNIFTKHVEKLNLIIINKSN